MLRITSFRYGEELTISYQLEELLTSLKKHSSWYVLQRLTPTITQTSFFIESSYHSMRSFPTLHLRSWPFGNAWSLSRAALFLV